MSQSTKPSLTLSQHELRIDKQELEGALSEKKSRSSSLGEILLLSFLVSIPLMVFSAGFIYLIIRFSVTQSGSPIINLPTTWPVDYDTSTYYYINFSATRLTFIASWSSSIAPTLVGFVMALLARPLSKTLATQSKVENAERLLPTPHQYSIILDILSGQVGSLWKYCKYNFQKPKAKSNSVLSNSAKLLMFTMALSFLIIVADTVLHITTTTSQFVQYEKSSVPKYSFGKGIGEYCASYTRLDSFDEFCTSSGRDDETLYYSNEVYSTQNNLSDENQIFTIPNSLSSVPNKMFLGPAISQVPSLTDFIASTVGIETSCTPISTKCNFNVDVGAITGFNCSNAFSGNLAVPELYNAMSLEQAGYYSSFLEDSHNLAVGVFDDADLTTVYTLNQSSAPNPFYIGVGAIAKVGADNSLNDSEIVTPMHGGAAFILSCAVTTLDLTYAWQNETISLVDATPSNSSVPYNMLGVLWQMGPKLGIAIDLAGIQPNSSALANSWANSFSQVAISLFAGAYSSRANIAEQTRKEFLVAKMPRAAVWALVGCNLLFSVFGLGVAFLTLWTIFSERGINELVERVSIQGLAQQCFEAEEKEFEEKVVGDGSRRVAAVRGRRGWVTQSVRV